MRAEVGVAGKRGGLLGVHVGVGERLVVGTAPAVEVDTLGLGGVLEQLAPAGRARGGRLRGAMLGGVGERALQVAAQGLRVGDANLGAFTDLLAGTPPLDAEA